MTESKLTAEEFLLKRTIIVKCTRCYKILVDENVSKVFEVRTGWCFCKECVKTIDEERAKENFNQEGE